MSYILIRHKVKDYSTWKPYFDAHASTRANAGCKGGKLYKNTTDPNELFILFKWDDAEKAKQFAHSDDLKQRMQEAGVVGQPEVFFLEKIEKFSE